MKLPLAHKPTQGTTARLLAFGLLSAMWAWGGITVADFLIVQLQWTVVIDALPADWGIRWAHVVGFGTWLLLSALTWLIINGRRTATVLIETEQEMRKVNWPTADRVVNSSIVVVLCVIVFTVVLFSADFALSRIIDVLGLW